MSRWPRGEAQIEQLIATKQLQQVIGGQANGAHLLQKASRTLATAGEIADQDPDSAYVLAYDAARYSGTAILAHQGLRPTTSGGHYAVEVALRAQFGDRFRPLEQCGDDATNSSTQPGPARPPPTTRHKRPSRTPRGCCWQLSSCCPPSPSSDRDREPTAGRPVLRWGVCGPRMAHGLFTLF
jgi:hypothetical protein